jgi:hypothetical protein
MDVQDNLHKVISINKQIEINNIEERIVEGYVTDDKIDLDGHVIDKDGFRDAILDYLKWGNIREQHGEAVGTVTDAPEWNKLVAKIVDDSAWKKIKSGVYKGFSVGIRVLESVMEPVEKYTELHFDGLPQAVINAVKQYGFVLRVTKMVLVEVSVVDRPANPRAMITAYKTLGTGEQTLPVAKEILTAQEEILRGHTMEDNINKQAEAVEQEIVPVEESAEIVASDVETEQEIQKELELAEDQITTDLDEKIAILEKVVANIDERVSTFFAEINEKLTQLSGEFLKAAQSESETTQAQAIEPEAAQEFLSLEQKESEITEQAVTEESNKSLDATFDVDGLVEKLYAKLESTLVERVTKAIEEANGKHVERIGGVNGESGASQDITKSVAANDLPIKQKPTYKGAAATIARALIRE